MMMKFLNNKHFLYLVSTGFFLWIFLSVPEIYAQTVSPVPSVATVTAPPQACGITGAECCEVAGSYSCVFDKTDTPRYFDKDSNEVDPKLGFDKCLCLVDPSNTNVINKCTTVVSDPQSEVNCRQCFSTGGIYTAVGCIPSELSSIIQAFFLIAISLASFVSVLCIIFAAIKLQFGPAKGDANAVATARSNIVSCLIGLVFLLFSVFIINVLSGGILGFKIDTYFFQPGSGGSTPPPGPVPPVSGTPNPSVSPVPPNPGKPSNSIITPEQVEEAVRFYEALKAADNGSCGTINQNNVANCLSLVNTGVPHEQGIRDRLPGEMKAINEFNLQCAGFAKAIYMIFTGEWMYGEFNGKPLVKNLKEPFWRFTYYPLGTTTPALGDYVKWTNDPAGHVAVIVNIIDDNKFEVIQANVDETRTQACPGCINRGPVSVTEAGLAGFYRLEK